MAHSVELGPKVQKEYSTVSNTGPKDAVTERIYEIFRDVLIPYGLDMAGKEAAYDGLMKEREYYIQMEMQAGLDREQAEAKVDFFS